MHKDISISAITAGLLAVIISYSGPLVIFFTAAQIADVPDQMMSSWVWAISIGAAITGIFLSVWLKAPIITAWSAPGTALLITLFPDLSLNEAVGAYITAAAILILLGYSGYFDKIIDAIPKGITHAMLAGILFQFGVNAFLTVELMPALSIPMIIGYLIFKRFMPRYCLPLILLLGLCIAAMLGHTNLQQIEMTVSTPIFITPEWSFQSTLSLAIPLVIVSLSGQFLPGFAILKASGYNIASKPILVGTGLVSLFTALFGGITTVIAAITAAICTQKDAHPDPDKRYVAGIANGVFYLIGAFFSGTIIALFTALPEQFVAILAGLALLGAISSNLFSAAQETSYQEVSIITFLVTASGMSFLGIGAAFWGIVVGLFAYAILHGGLVDRVINLRLSKKDS